jgi:hypothetical protein
MIEGALNYALGLARAPGFGAIDGGKKPVALVEGVRHRLGGPVPGCADQLLGPLTGTSSAHRDVVVAIRT